MSDRGDEGFQPHPGDPWHPEWTLADESGAVEPAPGDHEEPKKRRRGIFRRRRSEDETIDDSGGDATAPPPPPAAEAPVAAPRPLERALEPEGPLPAWLSDTDDPDPALPVELPSWVGATTAGAEATEGVFAEPVIEADEFEDDDLDGAAAEAASSPTVAGDLPDDLAAVLEALGEDGDAVEVIAPGAPEQLDDDGVALEEFTDRDALPAISADPSPEAAAARSQYGVAGAEAFEVLRDLDEADDVDEWHEYAGTPEALRPGAPPLPDVPIEVAAEEAPTRRRGIWPFRHKDPEAEEIVAEEATDWADDGTAIPRAWFAEIDEDTVSAPPADLPETEWPVAGAAPSAAVEPDPAGFDDAATAMAPEAATPERLLADDPTEELDIEPPGLDEVIAAVAPAAEEAAVEEWVDQWVEPDELPMPAGVGDARDSAPLAFDDGEIDAVSDEDEFDDEGEDRWVTGPIDLGSGYGEPTEVLPGGYASVDDLSHEIYRTAGTSEHRGLAEEIFLAGDEEREWQAMSAAMPGVETGVVGFEDVADLGTDEEYLDTRVRSDIGTRVLTGAVLAGFFLGSLWVAPEALAGFIAIIVLLGLGELFATVRRRGLRPLSIFGFVGGLAVLATTWFHGPVAIPATLALTLVAIFFVYAFSPLRRDALTNGGLTILGLAWVVGTAAFAFPILASAEYRVLILALVGVTAAMDIGAYAIGRAWGNRALAPVLSPNKSVEGLIGGIAASMLAGAAIGSFLEPFDLMSGIGLGIVVVLTAPLGDLAESMLKRSLGVKDMGSILPGHGGILDRIDALLFVIPAAWVFFQTIGLLG